jgi:hypothetical protein
MIVVLPTSTKIVTGGRHAGTANFAAWVTLFSAMQNPHDTA